MCWIYLSANEKSEPQHNTGLWTAHIYIGISFEYLTISAPTGIHVFKSIIQL